MIITFASSKGGVGKSTICASIAGAFCARGQRVHIIDLDKNKTIDRWYQGGVDIQNLTVSAIAPETLSDKIIALNEQVPSPDYILIDVAGVFEKTMILAMARSDLVIIPAQPSEPDIFEANKVVKSLQEILLNFNGNVPYRILINLFDHLHPKYQDHAVEQIKELGLKRLDHVVYKRAPYREIFMTVDLPHFADKSRTSVTKTIDEIDLLVSEIEGLIKKDEVAA